MLEDLAGWEKGLFIGGSIFVVIGVLVIIGLAFDHVWGGGDE